MDSYSPKPWTLDLQQRSPIHSYGKPSQTTGVPPRPVDGGTASKHRRWKKYTSRFPPIVQSWSGPSHLNEQTQQARFEAMRRTDPMLKRRANHNKQLLVVHKDLQRQCDTILLRHDCDARLVRSQLRRDQMEIEERGERLKIQKKKLDFNREMTEQFLDRLQRAHARREATLFHKTIVAPKPRDIDIIRAIDALAMPRSMKRRLQFEGVMALDPGEVEFT